MGKHNAANRVMGMYADKEQKVEKNPDDSK